MTKRVPPVNESGQALHSDTAVKLGENLEKGLRSSAEGPKKADGDPIQPVTSAEKGKSSDASDQSILDRIQNRIRGRKQKPGDTNEGDAELAKAKEFLRTPETQDHDHLYETEIPERGQLARLLRLEIGRDKLLVNQGKITGKVRKMLNLIEAQDGYLKAIGQKIMNRKHRGIVLDLETHTEADPDSSAGTKKPTGTGEN